MLHNTKSHYSRHTIIVADEIKKHIDCDPFQFKKAGDLLSHLNISNRNCIVKAFKDQHGVGIAQYMVMQRLEGSKKLLDQGISIKIISGKSCYKKQSSYCKAFKRAFKITPSEWQRLRGNEGQQT